jgi:YHS domain-containing protein
MHGQVPLSARFVKGVVLAAALLTLAGCAPMSTQSPGHGLSPVNAVAEGSDRHLMLFGYDVVSYFTDGKEMKGSPEIKSVYKDVTFRFASAEHKKLFDAAPEKYIPQFGGYCTNGIVYGIPWGGNADTWEMIGGKLYIFGGKGSHDAFMLDVPRNMALADKYWGEEVNGSNAFWQRSYRLVFRVPHYKSGAELAADVEAAKKKG